MIVLGDNPFFGVNHASVARAQTYYKRLQARDWTAAHSTMRAALENGIDRFMVTTHPEAPSLLRSMMADEELRQFSIVPAVPYLHRLNGLVATRGISAAFLQSLAYRRLFRTVLRGGSLRGSSLYAFVVREIMAVEEFGFQIPAIALQNIFVDLLLGLGLGDLINELAVHAESDDRQIIAISMNPILADKVLDARITVCTHYNYLGYMVQPTLRHVQEWIGSTERKVWAMGVLASGRAELSVACRDPYLRKFGAIVLGASRPASIKSFVASYGDV